MDRQRLIYRTHQNVVVLASSRTDKKNPYAVRTQLESSLENTYECYLRKYRISNTVDSWQDAHIYLETNKKNSNNQAK